ncbi:restriction endonuclease subunit S [Amycolatopsis taiwanensis]|uniref:Type I restriction-modification protein subunit S n=1 Tax=Amycolatopsis taiwanensis TaxID=342230 RepID=A0A9W6R6N4_9PSEU|nr:restriction endonuclease subunit S [Amycolatopsis taiwanensis]GLY69703.1 type I restriction-modification protein subunit S [Amycolatopsis taiwanensis]
MNKRYTEYVDSGVPWIGDVPAGWTTRPLWSMFERIKDVGHPDERMLSVFRDYGVVAKDSRDNINKTAENRNIYQLVHPGWLVTNRMKAWQGSVGISGLRGIVSGHYICFAPRHDADSRYLNWLFRSPTYAAGYALQSRGVRIGQAEIDNDLYRVMPVLLPPMAEQRAIADYLDRETARIDTLVEEQQRLIEMLRERRAAVISSALAPIDSWVRRRIKHIGETSLGKMLDAGRAVRDGDQLRPYVRAADVRADGSVNLVDLNEMPFSDAEMEVFDLRAGDVLLIEGGATVGRPGFMFESAPGIAFQKTVNRLRVGPQTDARFVYWSMLRLYESAYYANHYGSVSFVHLTGEKLREIELHLPPLDEQRAIAAYLDEQTLKIDALIAETERFIELARERRAALITAVVTGQIDVREMA